LFAYSFSRIIYISHRYSGLRVLGVIENMGALSVSLGGLVAGAVAPPLTLVDAQGNDVTRSMLAK
jgi:LytS/YehU family sensor histidine kinase